MFLVLKNIPIVPQYQLNCTQQKKGGVVIVVWEHTVSGHGENIAKDGGSLGLLLLLSVFLLLQNVFNFSCMINRRDRD